MSIDYLLAQRNASIQPFYAMDILAQAGQMEAEGREVIHLEVGEPDFPTPPAIVQAAHHALDQGQTRYTSALGLSSLRQAISEYYHSHYNTKVDAARVIITTGASGALFLALAAIVDNGDKIAITDPGYPCNSNFIRLFAGQTVTIPLQASDGFEVTVDIIRQHWCRGTKALLLASPANPTGRIISKQQLEEILEFVKSQSAILLMDEIYLGLVYGQQTDEKACTALSIDDDLVVINSFSKYFCMTGWRLGWLVVPASWVAVIEKIAQNVFLSPPSIAQHAALAAFEAKTLEQLELNRLQFEQRRDYMYPALKKLGFQLNYKPEGAFYLYADCSDIHADSTAFAKALLAQSAVAITPGKDFAQHAAEKFVRISYTASQAQLEQAVAAIQHYLAQC